MTTDLSITLLNAAQGHDIFDVVGFIPEFLSANDDRPASEQFNERYVSGWSPFKGFVYNPDNHTLKYPGDPLMKPLARIDFRDEVIFVYPYSWVGITKEGSDDIEVCRMD